MGESEVFDEATIHIVGKHGLIGRVRKGVGTL
jgi:hypothetical protein